MTKNDKLIGAYRTYIIEFPEKTGNLVNYDTIGRLMEIFQTIRTGSEDSDPRGDQEGQVEDMRRVYAMLRDAETRQSVDFIEEIIEKATPKDVQTNQNK
tara:strand:- start:9935 stop:10231 length:297 start_codon:yes stop_codon:yes gene_type:complete